MCYPQVRLLVLFAATSLLAQSPRLYNQRLDKQADELKRLAESTANGQFFDTELQNLDMLAQPTIDRIFSSARRLALAKINNTFTWKDLRLGLEKMAQANALGGAAAKAWGDDLQKRIDAERQAVNDAKTVAPGAQPVPDLAIEIVEHVSEASELFDALDGLRKKTSLTKTDVRVAGSLTDLVGEFADVLKAINQTATAPGASDATRRMKLALLRADLDHVAALGKIESRRLAALTDVEKLHAAASDGVRCMVNGGDDCEGNPFAAGQIKETDTIEATLASLRAETRSPESRARLQTVLYLLQNYAALCARANIPNRLAEARMAVEVRRNGIRRDAIVAGSFESVLASGAQSIAAYYKGGIRPEVLAQLAQALATAGLIPAVVSK